MNSPLVLMGSDLTLANKIQDCKIQKSPLPTHYSFAQESFPLISTIHLAYLAIITQKSFQIDRCLFDPPYQIYLPYTIHLYTNHTHVIVNYFITK